MPGWILDAFAVLMLGVASVSAARLGSARFRRRVPGAAADVDVAHLAIGVAMAGMLAPSLVILPGVAWLGVLGLLTAWFAWRVARDARANGVRALASGHCVPHLVHGASMVYLVLALGTLMGSSAVGAGTVASGAAVSGTVASATAVSGTASHALAYPTLAFVFALILVGYGIWDLDQLSGRRYSAAGGRDPAVVGLAPAVCCRIVMSVTMAFMLLVMI